MASRVAALLLLGVICFELAAAEMPVDCCLHAADKRLSSKNIESYRIQNAGNGCDIDATVFYTVKGKKLCVVHPSKKQWVHHLIKIIDQKQAA
ncbi:monocyte chemotactic protein 1B-like [Pholidichthys leucotaenia]